MGIRVKRGENMKTLKLVLGGFLLTGTFGLKMQATSLNTELTTGVEAIISEENEATSPTEEVTIDGATIEATTQTIATIFPDSALADILAMWLETTVDAVITDEQLSSLKALIIADENVLDLTGIERLTGIESLGIYGTQIVSLNQVTQLPNLHGLYLLNNSKLLDYSVISELLPLVELSIVSDVIEVLPIIQNINSMEALKLMTPLITDYSQISEMRNLKTLFIQAAGENIETLDFLQNLDNLSFLIITGTNVEDLTPIMGLKNLTALNVGGNRITNLTPLSYLKNLKYLSADYNYISDVTILKELPELVSVNLSYNSILDASPLLNITEVNLQFQVVFFQSKLPGKDIFIENQVRGLDGNLIAPTFISDNGYYDNAKIYFDGVTNDMKPTYTFNEGSAREIPLPDLSGIDFSNTQSLHQTVEERFLSEMGFNSQVNEGYSFSGIVSYFFTTDGAADVVARDSTVLPETGEGIVESSILGVSITCLGILLLVIKRKN